MSCPPAFALFFSPAIRDPTVCDSLAREREEGKKKSEFGTGRRRSRRELRVVRTIVGVGLTCGPGFLGKAQRFYRRSSAMKYGVHCIITSKSPRLSARGVILKKY